MNLRSFIYRAKTTSITFYCILFLFLYVVIRYHLSKPVPVNDVPKHLRRYLMFNEKFKFPQTRLSNQEITKLTSIVEVVNYEREIFNMHLYGAMRVDTPMVVVQVGRDAERLQHLVISLAQVNYINTVLLVFSHSYYDERLNKLIMSINFCRFMQIFYPYSLQLYPNRFPGIDAEDCLSFIGRTDKFCSSRDARLIEHKHHWWWKACFVFSNMDWSENYRGTVLFLEEDNYVLPDLLYLLKYATRSLQLMQELHIMSFGRPYAKGLDYDLLLVDAWHPPFDKGIAFNTTVWRKIVEEASYYCMYDDLSWSYSLLNVLTRFREGRGGMVATMAPRVLSTSMFPSGRDASIKIHEWKKTARLFPKSIKMVSLYSSRGRVNQGLKLPPRGNGGWGDMRDHLLCLDPLMSTTTSGSNDQTTTLVSDSPEYEAVVNNANVVKNTTNSVEVKIKHN